MQMEYHVRQTMRMVLSCNALALHWLLASICELNRHKYIVHVAVCLWVEAPRYTSVSRAGPCSPMETVTRSKSLYRRCHQADCRHTTACILPVERHSALQLT